MHLFLALLLTHPSPVPLPPSRLLDTARAQEDVLLRVLAINDLHGALEPQTWPWSGGRAVGGAPALKAWFDTLSRACHCTTVRLDGGDEMQGTLLSNFGFGRAAVAALNTFGIDAAGVGSHEFDWSVDTLRARMAEAHYRFLAANITDTTGRARPDWAEPWTVIERGGQKIAVIGLALRATPTNTAPRNVAGLAFGDGAAAVKRVLPRARAAASFVIVVAHEGAFCDGGGEAAARPLAATACHGEILDVARRLDSGSVDLIVSGHTHSLVNTVVNGIPVVQARSSGAGIAVVDFVRGPGGRREVLARIETPYTDRVSPDPELQNLMARFKVGIENLTSRAIARIKADLRRQGDEYGLGRLIADAMRNVAKAEVAIVNNGGIRADLAAGTATYGDLYRVMPFQNRLLRLTVKGDVLRRALEHAVAGERPDGHVSGIELWYDPKQRPGRRSGKATLADGVGRPVDAGGPVGEGGGMFRVVVTARRGPPRLSKEALRRWPKAELHVHLDGCLRPETMLELARAQGVRLPADTPEALTQALSVKGSRSLEEYLSKYEITLSVMQAAEALERIAYEFVRGVAAQHVRYVEVRYSPALHRPALTLTEAIEAPLAGIKRAEAETGTKVGLIICGIRTLPPAVSLELAQAAADYRSAGVVAFDLAGAERGHPAADERAAFAHAARHGLACTCHAGEGDGPDSIHEALHACGARRIGHGTRLGEDPALLAYVVEHRIPLEMCLSSNVHTRTVAALAEHPFKRYLDQGVVVTLNTDGRLMDGISLTDEYYLAHAVLGLSRQDLARVVLASCESAFLPEYEKVALISRVQSELEAL